MTPLETPWLPATSVAEDNGLPEGWVLSSVSECVEILDSRRVPVNSEERAKRQGRVPYYGATGQVGWIDDYLFNEELLLLGEDGAPFLDKSQPISYVISGKSWVNNHAHVLRAVVGLTSNRFLKFWLDTFDFSDYVTGSTRLKLTQTAMTRIPVSLPPANEQHRIVQKIEDLLRRVMVARNHLSRVRAILKRFRQAVLAAACSGRLTEDWREERLEVSQSSVSDGIAGNQTSDDQDLRDLPSGWAWVLLSSLGSDPKGTVQTGPFGAQLHRDEFTTTGVPVIAVGNLTGMGFTTDGLYYISERKAQQLAKYDVQAGDVLFARSGATLGKVCVAPEFVNNWRMTGHILRARFDSQVMLPEFAVYSLHGDPEVKAQVMTNVRGVTRPGFNTTLLETIRLPLPPMPEQREILSRVRMLFKIADSIEARLTAVRKCSDALTQSILAKAFRGELVPTEAELARREGRDYEPASVLLERIRSERASKAKNFSAPRRKIRKANGKGGG